MGEDATEMFNGEKIALQGLIPVVVNINDALPLKLAGGVHVAVNVVAFGVKTPPDIVDQIPPVAAVTDPVKFTVVFVLHNV